MDVERIKINSHIEELENMLNFYREEAGDRPVPTLTTLRVISLATTDKLLAEWIRKECLGESLEETFAALEQTCWSFDLVAGGTVSTQEQLRKVLSREIQGAQLLGEE